ncbi:MAG: methyltransferase [Paenibacillus sp.]|nr:methyltransferase [Paenibacillus sp.]
MEEEYIGGRHSVLEALRSGRTIHKLYVADQAQKGQLTPLLAEAKSASSISWFKKSLIKVLWHK